MAGGGDSDANDANDASQASDGAGQGINHKDNARIAGSPMQLSQDHFTPPRPEPVAQALAADAQLWATLRSRPGVTLVASREEARVVDSVSRFLKRAGSGATLNGYSWSVVTGLVGLKNRPQDDTDQETRMADAALGRALTLAADPAGGILVFRDLHRYFDSPSVCRLIRECAHAMHGQKMQMIIVASEARLPDDLRSDVVILDYPLPDESDIAALVDTRARELAAAPKGFVVDRSPQLRKAVSAALSGLTMAQADNALARAVIENGGLTGDVVASVHAAKRQAVRSTSCLDVIDSPASLNEVGGLDRLKDWLTKRSGCFGDRAREFGIRAPRGVLALGVPGGGKSLAARAAADTLGLPLLRLDTGAIYGGLVGESESNVRRALAVADAMGPCVLWVDEIEKGFGHGGGESDGSTSQRVLGTLLTWMSERQAPVFIFATSNDVSRLPPELIRKGRFDEVFYVDLPNTAERRDIFRIHIGKSGRDAEGFDLELLAENSSGFVGGEIEQVIQEALVNALSAGKPDIATEDILSALSETIPLVRAQREIIERLRAWVDDGRVVSASSGESQALTRTKEIAS